MKRYIGTCLPHAGRYMQSRTGAVTQVSILPQSFFLPRGTRAFPVFSLCSANCNEKIAAPRLTRVTNATKICRTSLVARYAAPPCVTRYAATYIASTVFDNRASFTDPRPTCSSHTDHHSGGSTEQQQLTFSSFS